MIEKNRNIFFTVFLKREIYIFLLFLLCITACDIINPVEKIPSFIQITNFDLDIDQSQGGGAEHISDIWVFVEGNSLGLYELPVKIPILAEGSQGIQIFPVIRENGLRSTPIIYPFYESFDTSISLLAEGIISVQPRTTYLTGDIFFELIEDFESTNHALEGLNPEAVNITRESSNVKYGNGAGQVFLNNLEEVAFTSSATYLDLPTDGLSPVYLELDYKTNVAFEVGLVGIDPNPLAPVRATNYKIILCPSDKWERVYINFTEDLQISQLPAYQIAFRISKDNLGCEPINNDIPQLLIDNVKLIRPQN